jgi:hypothetical protein
VATKQFIGYATRATLAKFAGYSGIADSAGFDERDSTTGIEAPISRTFPVEYDSFEVEC